MIGLLVFLILLLCLILGGLQLAGKLVSSIMVAGPLHVALWVLLFYLIYRWLT